MSSTESLSSSEDQLIDRTVTVLVVNTRVTLPPHPTFLSTGRVFELVVPRTQIYVENDRNRYPARCGYVQKTEIHLPTVSMLAQSETFLSDFNMKMTIVTPVLTKIGQSDPSVNSSISLNIVSDPLIATVSQANYSLFLQLLDLNLSYDDHLEKLISPGAIPPSSTDFHKFAEVAFTCDGLSVLLQSQSADICELILSNLQIGLDMFNDGYRLINLHAQTFEVMRPDDTEPASNPFSLLEDETRPGYRLRIEMIEAKCEDCEGEMLALTMRKDRLGNNTITSHLRGLRVNLDTAFAQEISNFLVYAMHDYSKEKEIDVFAYMKRLRPKSGQTFDSNIDSEYFGALLDFELTLSDSEFVLSKTSYTCFGDISYNYLKQNDRNLLLLKGKQIHTSTHALIRNFTMKSLNQREKSSRSSYSSTILEPISVNYSCCQYQDRIRFPEKQIYGYELNGTVSPLSLTLTIGDVEGLWKWHRRVTALVEDRKHIIDELAEGAGGNNPFEVAPERDTFIDLSQSSSTVGSSSISRSASPPCLPEPQSQPLNSFLYTLEQLDLMLIDDKNGLYKPLLWVKGSEEEFKGEEDPGVQAQSLLRASFVINLYSQIADVWEPIIEHCFVGYKAGFVAHPQGTRREQVAYFDKLMINLTENQIKTLGYVLSSYMSGVRPSGSEMVAASPFTVTNLTFYPLFFIGETSEVEISPGGSYAVTLPASESRQFFPQLTLDTVYRRGKHRLSDLKVNRVSSQELVISNPVEDSDYRLYCDVEMDKGRKVVKVRSPVMFLNETSQEFRLIADPGWGKKQWDIKADSESPLPFDCLGVLKVMIFHNDFIVCQIEDFWELLRSTENLHVPLSDRTTFVCLHIDPCKQCPRRYSVRILAPIIVSNALPLQCEIALGNTVNSLNAATFETVDSGCRLVNYDVRNDQVVYAKIRVPGFQETEAAKLFNPAKKPKKRAVRLTDKSECNAEVLVSVKFTGQVLASIHAPVIIDNTTSLPLLFLYKKTGMMHKVAGQQSDLMLDDYRQKVTNDSIQIHHSFFFCCLTKKLQIELNKHKSEAFKIGTVGAQKVISIEGGKERDGDFTLHQLVFNVRFIWPLNDNEIYCKLVTVSPRFILNNLLSKPLLLYQVGSRRPIVLRSRTSTPYFWPDGRKQELLKLSIAEVEKWDWSGTFSISNIGACTLQCLHKPTRDFMLIRTEIRQQDIAGLVTFQEDSETHPEYLIENQSKTFSVCVYQEGYPEFLRYVNVNSSKPFAWASLMHGHVIIVTLLYGQLDEFPLDLNEVHRVNPDAINTLHRFKVSTVGYKGAFVYIRIASRGSTKVVQISDEKPVSVRKRDLNSENVGLVIPIIGISLVENAPKRASELLFITLHGLELAGTRDSRLQTLNLSIKKVQVDNQYDPLAHYPVFLSILDVPNNPAVQLQLSYYLSGEPDCYNIDKCEILIQEVCLEAESFVVQRIISLSSRISSEFLPSKPELSTAISMKYRSSKSLMVSSGVISHLSQISTVRIENLKQISFGSLKIHPVLINVTFAPLRDIYEMDESFDMLISALGLPIMNIKAAPMKFYAVELKNVFGARWQLLHALTSFYRAQVASEIFSIVGHADVIGNPLGILNNLGEGVADLFYEPCKGVMNGPMSAGKGLLKGAKSFFSKTIYATFGTVSRLTGTLSAGLNSISSDREYQLQLQRERAKNQPKDVVDGLGNGVKALVRSVSKGITGVVVEPYKGAKEDGFAGLLKGSLKGVGGLVMRPITGILDIASHTSEGIVNTADMFDSRKKVKRVRSPRVTYSDSGTIKPFNEEDSEVCFFMIKLKSKRYLNCHFVQQILESDAKGEAVLYVNYSEFLVLVSVKEHKATWIVPSTDLLSYAMTRFGVMLYTKPSQRKVRCRQKTRGQTEFLIPFASRAIMTRVAGKLRAEERTVEE